jgi:hypothetical protein
MLQMPWPPPNTAAIKASPTVDGAPARRLLPREVLLQGCNIPRFYQILGEIFAFVLLEMIGNSQGFKNFESI